MPLLPPPLPLMLLLLLPWAPPLLVPAAASLGKANPGKWNKLPLDWRTMLSPPVSGCIAHPAVASTTLGQPAGVLPAHYIQTR